VPSTAVRGRDELSDPYFFEGTDVHSEPVLIKLCGKIQNTKDRSRGEDLQKVQREMVESELKPFPRLRMSTPVTFYTHAELTIREPADNNTENADYVERVIKFTSGRTDMLNDNFANRFQSRHKEAIASVDDGVGLLDLEGGDQDLLVCDVQAIFVLPPSVVNEQDCPCQMKCGLFVDASEFNNPKINNGTSTAQKQRTAGQFPHHRFRLCVRR
jgi:hypothetical protein